MDLKWGKDWLLSSAAETATTIGIMSFLKICQPEDLEHKHNQGYLQ